MNRNVTKSSSIGSARVASGNSSPRLRERALAAPSRRSAAPCSADERRSHREHGQQPRDGDAATAERSRRRWPSPRRPPAPPGRPAATDHGDQHEPPAADSACVDAGRGRRRRSRAGPCARNQASALGDVGSARPRQARQELAGAATSSCIGVDQRLDAVEASPCRAAARRTRPRPRRRRARGRRGRARRTRRGARARRRRSGWCRRDRGGVALAGVEPAQPAGVHPVGGSRGDRRAVGTLAVGKPSSRPRWSPSTTTPRTVNGRPERLGGAGDVAGGQAGADVGRGPDLRAAVEGDALDRRSRASRPALGQQWPRRRRPGGRTGSWRPTTTAAACRASTRTRSMNSSGDHAAISRSKRQRPARRRRRPSSSSRGARRRSRSASVGACSGRSTAIGCGSKVTATTRSRPRSVGDLAGPARARAGARGGRRRSCRW